MAVFAVLARMEDKLIWEDVRSSSALVQVSETLSQDAAFSLANEKRIDNFSATNQLRARVTEIGLFDWQ